MAKETVIRAVIVDSPGAKERAIEHDRWVRRWSGRT